jgi:membrane fusion protein, multidrug efflux system
MMKKASIMTNKKMTTKMNELKTIISLLFVITIMGCNQTNNASSENTPAKTIDSIAAFILQSSSLDKNVSLPGELLPYEKVQVNAKVNAYIKKLFVDIGSPVNKDK